MIGFEIRLNGKMLKTAGARDLGLMVAQICADGKLGPSTNIPASEVKQTCISVHVDGKTSKADADSNIFKNWDALRKIVIGNQISIKVLEVDKVDKYTSTYPFKNEREWFMMCRENYLRLKDKYEPAGSENS